MLTHAAGTVVLSLWLATFAAYAQDSVKVRFNSGYPRPDQASEFLQLSVSRVDSAVPGQQARVDKYFETVSRILAENQVPAKWGSIMVDGPYVEIDIILSKIQFTLANTYDSTGFVVPMNATEADRRVAVAVQAILDATVKQAQSRLSTK